MSREIPFATIWSWGWGEWSASDRDPDKPAAACVYLWTRDPPLCDGPPVAGPGFDRRLTVGQLNVPAGAQCTTPWGPVKSGELAGLARVTGDREIAYTSLFARLVLKGYIKVKSKELRAAERAIVRYRFGGSGAAYRGALARAGASRSIALGVIADELRQARIERRFQVKSPSGAQVASYRESYSDTPARLVEATPAPVVARPPPSRSRDRRNRSGLDLPPPGPHAVDAADARRPAAGTGARTDRPAGSVLDPGGDLVDPRRARTDRPGRVFDNWLMQRESAALAATTCRRDWLPAVGPMELANQLPFLALPAS